MCGYCYIRKHYKVGSKERTVFAFLAEFDKRLCHFVRDKQLGCGVRRRPDGYMDLVVTFGNRVMFIVEVDEDFHRRIDVKCELVRLQEIHDGYGGALYVLRYNPDQPGGLEEDALTSLAQRCVDILDGDIEYAIEEFGCMLVEYIGYPEARVDKVNREWFESQITPQ
jgi:hypothetical protein